MTQTLTLKRAPRGITAVKLFDNNSDTLATNGVAATVVAGTNNPTRYVVTWSATVANGTYQLVAYNGTTVVAGTDVVVSGDSVTEVDKPSEILSKLAGGSVTWTAPVTAAGTIDQPIVIGDDYFASSSRALDWYVDPGVFPVANATCFFGGKSPSKPGWKVQGTVSAVVVDSVPKWRLRFELANTDTGALQPATYEWSVELRGPLPEHMTQIRGKVVVVDSYTR